MIIKVKGQSAKNELLWEQVIQRVINRGIGLDLKLYLETFPWLLIWPAPFSSSSLPCDFNLGFWKP